MSSTPLSSDLLVYLTTYNLGLQGQELKDGDLKAWLAPAFRKDNQDPDLVVISVQELTELYWTRECFKKLF